MTNTNIVQFPRSAIVRDMSAHTSEKLQEAKKLGEQNYADSLISDIAEDIHMALQSCGVDTDDRAFLKDFMLLHGVLSALIYRDLELPHRLHEFLDSTVEILDEEADESSPELPLEDPPE